MTRNFELFENKGAYSPVRLIPGLFEAYSGLIEAYRPLPQGQNKPLNPPLRGLEAYCPEGCPGRRLSPRMLRQHRLTAFMGDASSRLSHILDN